MRIRKSGHEISSVEDWKRWAPPSRGDLHWKDGRSAKELARSWFRPTPPEELRTLLEKTFGSGLVFEEAKPECVVQLDDFKGEQRNCDLVVLCRRESERIVVSLEAKADEPFGENLVGEYYNRTLDSRSNVPKRIDNLCRALFGTELNLKIRQLRYQLLHSAAAALIETANQNAGAAVFLVHEFHARKLNPVKVKQNLNDWIAFVRAFPNLTDVEVERNKVFGPVRVPGGGRVPGDMPLYLGNLVTEI